MQLPLEKQNLLDNELNSNELVRWSGEPNPTRHAIKAIPPMGYSILFILFSMFWIYTLVVGGFDCFVALFGLSVFLGLFILLMPLWKYLQARKMIYAVTDKRAIIVEGLFNWPVRSFRKSELDDIEHIIKSDGSGDLIFETKHVGSGRKRRVKKTGFIGIPRVKKVERLLQQI